MFSMMPYRNRHDMLQRTDRFPSLLDDRFFRSLFGVNDVMNDMGFRIDIHDKEDHYEMEAELPGVKEDQISLTVENDMLTVSADIQSEHKDAKACYCERRMGHVSRSFNLDGIDQEHITADYKNGILTVSLPKAKPTEAPGVRRILIGHGDEPAKNE